MLWGTGIDVPNIIIFLILNRLLNIVIENEIPIYPFSFRLKWGNV